MTDEEKKQLVDAVITQLKNDGTDVSNAKIEEDVNGVSHIIGYDGDGNIIRITPQAVNKVEQQNAARIDEETERAQQTENEIKSNAMQYNTWGVNVYADKVEIYGRSIDGKLKTMDFPAATSESAGVISAEDKGNLDSSVKNISYDFQADYVGLLVEHHDSTKDFEANLPCASEEGAGFMSADDKKTLESSKVLIFDDVFTPDTIHNWLPLGAIIPAGSLIEVKNSQGEYVDLVFYEERMSKVLQEIKGRGYAKYDFTYANNYEIIGSFVIKAYRRNQVEVFLKDEIEHVKDLQSKVNAEIANLKQTDNSLSLNAQTVYPSGGNLFFHDTKDDYKNLDVNTYIPGEHYIAVEGGKGIIASGNSYNVIASIYDSDYKYKTEIPVKANTTVTLPDNCSYIKWRVAVYDLINKSKIMVNYGTEVLPYSPFLTSLTSDLSENIEEVSNLLSVVNAKVEAVENKMDAFEDKVEALEDEITEYKFNFAGNYNWGEVRIKAGSVIEISGAGTILYFYENKTSTPQKIEGRGVADADYNLVNNQKVNGDFNIKVTERGKIGVLEDKINTVGDAVELQSLKDTTLYPVGDNLFYHSTHEDYSGLDNYTYITSDYYVGVQGGKTVFLSGNVVKMVIHEYDSDYEQIKTQSLSANTSYILSDNCAFIKWKVAVYDLKYNRTKIMVNHGTEVLPYSPFLTSLTSDLSENIEEVSNLLSVVNAKVEAFSKPQANLILTEPIALSSTSEHCLYLDDAIEGNAVGRKYGLTGTQFASYGSVAYVNKPAIGSKKGTFYALSAVDNVNDAITVKGVAPNPKAINMLDIGSSYIDIGTVTQRQYDNYVRDGYTVNILGTMGAAGKKHEARSGGTWDFLVKPLGRAVILDVNGVSNLPTTGYPGTTYQDENGVKWSVRGLVINGGTGKLVLSSFSVDTNYGGEAGSGNADYDVAANNLPSVGTLTKTTNDSTGTSTSGGDDVIQYSGKELVYYNPFWNPTTNELDFVYYINKWGFATPDIITLTFGSNDLGNFAEASQADVDAVVAKAVSVVNRIHEQLPNCKVLITCSCYGYKGVGNNDFRVVYRIKNIQKYYKTLIDRMGQSTSYADYVRVVPTMCVVDRENGFWLADKTLHSAYPAIKYASDIVHPNTKGFNQFADAMLGYAYDLLNE